MSAHVLFRQVGIYALSGLLSRKLQELQYGWIGGVVEVIHATPNEVRYVEEELKLDLGLELVILGDDDVHRKLRMARRVFCFRCGS
jgi:hypothetical protein